MIIDRRNGRPIYLTEDMGEEYLGFIPGEIDKIAKNDRLFYQDYVSKSLPAVVIDGASDWPAVEKWKNVTYLIE